MAMTYAEAEATFALARNKRTGRPLQNNTRLISVGPVLEERVSYGVELHNTVVIRFQPNGRVVLNSGGWRTMTTKDRINAYLPGELRVSSERGTWMIHQYDADHPTLERRRQRKYRAGPTRIVPNYRWELVNDRYESIPTGETHTYTEQIPDGWEMVDYQNPFRKVADFFDGIELRQRRSGEWVAVNKSPQPVNVPKGGDTPELRRGTELAWHCIGTNRKMRFSGETVEPGKAYSLPGRSKPVLCVRGFHGSARLTDALGYHPGPIVCRVELSGLIADAGDKMAATKRRVLWMVDASELLNSGQTERMVPTELETAVEALPRLAAGEATPMR